MKIILLSIVLILCGLSFYSCSNEEEVYSCDPEANEWAKENLDDIRKMTRSEWLTIDESIQRTAFVAFSPEQKATFWEQKIEEVLMLNWNKDEEAHLIEMQNYIKNNLDFSSDLTKENSIFIYKWTEYARENLKWNDKIIYALIFDGRFLNNTNGDLIVNLSSSKRLKAGHEVACDCNHSAVFTTCGNITPYSCFLGGCDSTIRGCGALWISGCDGQCLPS